MQFNTVTLIFLGVFFLIYPLTKSNIKTRWVYLTIASFLYYGLLGWQSCIVLFLVGILSYLIGLAIDKQRSHAKVFIYLGTLLLIAILLVVKYQIFLVANITPLFHMTISAIEQDYWLNKLSVFSLIGVGFYTLQAIGYLFDIYNKRIKATENIFLHFAFLSFFPKLLAGPIERNKTFLKQLSQITHTTEEERWHAFKNIIIGLFLKNIIANNLAPIVDGAFQNLVVNQSTLFWWEMVTAFAIQIYCDFNGYTHIVMGLAQLMGFNLMDNFRFPYISLSPSEFWTRWHISLSTWLREYIFFPLSRSKYLKGKYYINTWITMFLSGIWHGVGWTFIVWGGLHALYISLDQLMHWSTFLKKFTFGKFICLVFMWVQLDISWVFFKASSISQALGILRIMFDFNLKLQSGINQTVLGLIAAAILMDCLISLLNKRQGIIQPKPQRVLEVVVFSVLFVISIYFRGTGSQFIYFQF
jgi:alginate O-acetyltransferase complex protein AlgI